MSELDFFLVVALGVAIAVIYPTLVRKVLKHFPREAGMLPSWLKRALPKYILLFVFCVVTAGILVAVFRTEHPRATVSFWQALLLGVGFEATIEKLIFPKTTTGSEDKPQPKPQPEAPAEAVMPNG